MKKLEELVKSLVDVALALELYTTKNKDDITLLEEAIKGGH